MNVSTYLVCLWFQLSTINNKEDSIKGSEGAC
jgi:hypothetical protein